MDIKEHYITSLFFHVTAIFLVVAFSHTGLKTMPATLTVSLSSATSGKSPEASPASVQNRHKAEKQMNSISRDDKAPAVDEETSPQADTDAPKTVSDEPEAASSNTPDFGQDSAWLAQIHHARILQARIYMDDFSQSIQKGLLKAIDSIRPGGLREGTAEVTFFFNDEGGFAEVWGATSSGVLESALNHLDWGSVPVPGSYRIRMNALRVKISIEGGEPSLFLTVL